MEPVQGAIRREWQALSKDAKLPLLLTPLTYIHVGHAALAPEAHSLRASQEAVIRCVMPLGKGMAIPCEAGLAPKGTSCGARLTAS